MAVNKRKGLGKGLDALIPANAIIAIKKDESNTEVGRSAENVSQKTNRLIPTQDKTKAKEKAVKANGASEKADTEVAITSKLRITQIEPNKNQPRKNFNEDSLQELADSIQQVGIISPITVQKKGEQYIIIAGERRWRAAKIAGLKEVPVVFANYTDKEIAEIALIENIQREDLNPIEEAMGYKKLIEEFQLKQDEVAERVGKSRSALTNALRLLKLSESTQKMLVDEVLTVGHARVLIPIVDEEVQSMLAWRIVDEGLSVREAEKIVKNFGKPEKEKKVIDEKLKTIYDDIATKLKNDLGTKVNIVSKANGAGKFEIEFYSNDDFERIMHKIME